MMSENQNAANVSRRDILKKYKKKSRFQEMVQVYFRNKLAVLGLIIFLVIVFLAVFADVIADYDTKAIGINAIERLQAPSAKHIFGTDELGRDVFARVIHGGRISLRISLGAVLFATLVGGTLGAVAGYFGGKLDDVLMRVTDIFICLPTILWTIALVSSFGSSETVMLMAVGAARAPIIARVVRSSVLSVRNTEYVEAARAIGAKTPTIILRHVIVNAIGPIIVQITLNVATAILGIATVSFLGIGIQAPAPEWGAMLSGARSFMRDHSYLVLAPGMAIFLTIFSLNLIGDGLRDAFDPKLK